MSDQKNEESETNRFFPSGDWEGFYLQFADKHTMNCTLDFKNGIITGGGSDVNGGFSWKGTYSTESLSCKITKSYSTHTIIYHGDADENGIWGKWFFGNDADIGQEWINSFSEGFHIWPKKNEEQKEAVELEEVAIEKEETQYATKPLV